MKANEIRIGTRGSQLALYQANWVKARLMASHPHLNVTLTKITTTGDKIQDVPLAKVGGKGLFVKEIEDALLQERIDLAVHSMKDVPTEFPQGLHLSAITEREDPSDAFIAREGQPLANLREGARLGTSSLRRQAQLLYLRGDLEIVPLRGNVETRLRKLAELDLDGIILALAGLRRLGFADRVTEVLPFDVSLPAIGQGALGIESRVGDRAVEEQVRVLHHPDSATCVAGERAFLKRLDGGCQVPIAAHATMTGPRLSIEGLIAAPDGKKVVRHRLEGPVEMPESLGIELAELLLEAGGREILDVVYGRPAPRVSIDDQNNE
jgi:hydroxymethylbilane synthase